MCPDLLLKNSNVKCVWLGLDDPSKKQHWLNRVMEEGATEENKLYKAIEGAEGLWTEQSDMMSKWFRRESPSAEDEQGDFADPADICFAQFGKMFSSSAKGEGKQRDENQGQNIQFADIFPEADDGKPVAGGDDDDDDPDAKFRVLMCGGEEAAEKAGLPLPPFIKIMHQDHASMSWTD